MKKLLALVLAMVMTLGLATVGTNAVDKFADNDSIKFTEAATVMKAIGVFDGDDNGNFRPTDTLKRSEAAKIVAYLMLTKKTADGLIPSGTRYIDVPANHWAAGYIEYLTSEGVLGGVGNGMFNPDGDITGIDFAKMLLVALGYDAKLENLVLSDYRINTAKLANSIDLFEGNTDMVPTAAITRDEAVLYAFNMIKSPMVEYDSNVRVETGNGGAVTVGNNRAYEKTSSNQSKQTISFKKATRNAQYSTNAPWMVEFAEEKYPDLKLADVSDYDEMSEKGIGRDDFGRPSRKWLWKNEDLGRFVMTQDLVTSWTKKATAKMVYDQLGKTVYDSLYKYNSNLDVYLDGKPVVVSSITYGGSTLADVDQYINRDSAYKINNSGNGTVTELFMDKDKNVTIVTMNVYVYQAAADYNKSSKTLRITPAGETSDTGYRLKSNELKLEDFAGIEDYKADDYLLAKAAWTWNGETYEVKEIEKAEVISGKVDGYTSDGSYSVTIDGTKHDYAVTAENGDNGDDTRKTMYSVGKEAKIVVDKDGYIYAVDEAIVTSDYVFISKFGTGNSSLKTEAYASAYFTDGTDSTIKLKSVVDLSSTSSSKPQITDKDTIVGWSDTNTTWAGRWYTYSRNASNEYTLYAPQTNYVSRDGVNFPAGTAGTNVLLDGQVYFVAKAGVTYRADDKTVVVVNDNAKNQINVYTGVKNMPGIKLNDTQAYANVYVVDKNGLAKAVYVDLHGSALVTGSSSDNLIYVVKYDGSIKTNDEKNETHYQYQVLKNDGSGTKENIIADTKIADFNGKVYAAANYASKNSDGLYTKFYKANNTDSSTVYTDNGTVSYVKGGANEISYKNSALTLGGEGWTLADDAKITVIAVKYTSGNNKYDASVLNTDKSAEAEFHSWISGSELNGMFSNLGSYEYTYALRTTGSKTGSTSISNSGSREVKELYVTVWNASNSTSSSSTTTVSSADVDEVSKSLASAASSGYTVSASGKIASATYVPSDGGIYFTVKSDAAKAAAVRVGQIKVTEGTYTETLTGAVDAKIGDNVCYFVAYIPNGTGSNLKLEASYVDSTGAVATTADKYVESWTVEPSVTPASGTYTIDPSTVTISNVADSTFSITVKRADSTSNATTWSLSGTNNTYITYDGTASGSSNSLTITGKFDGPQASAPSINLTAANGGYTVTGNTIASSVKTAYDAVKNVSWVSTTTTSEDGNATVEINVSLNKVVDDTTLKGMFTLTPSDNSGASAEATNAVVSGLTGTVTFTVSGITKNINVTLAVNSVA